MRKIYDYSRLRPSTVTSPEYQHVLLLLGWVVYFIFYFLTENFIPAGECHVMHSIVDDMIPFVEYFVIFYVSWFALIVVSLLYFFLYDVRSFKRLQTFIIITQVIAMIIYILWPSVQNLRPVEFERQNFFTWLLGIIYAFDTPTGVCPSLHVAYSWGIAVTWLKRENGNKGVKVFITLLTVVICASVLFVKQHSFLDVLAAVPVSIVAELLVFGRKDWITIIKGKGNNNEKIWRPQGRH